MLHHVANADDFRWVVPEHDIVGILLAVKPASAVITALEPLSTSPTAVVATVTTCLLMVAATVVVGRIDGRSRMASVVLRGTGCG